ncbi:hypothetical protein GCM10009665_11230 [Kitasatospora nipponensis]|uniref:Nicotinate-nucleotide--dimethylbenzimidazole phosphoribosyltransferase n=1 Tax=Kitasatospora nipponensis TaxID=258049 RepID=A0ABN1VVT2_9ACTN
MTDGGHVPQEGRPEHLLPETGTDPAPGGGGWVSDLGGRPVAPGTPRPPYTFIDQPDRPDHLDDEDDVLLMPGPQGSWSDAATPVVPLTESLGGQGGYSGAAVFAVADGSIAFPSAAQPLTPAAPELPADGVSQVSPVSPGVSPAPAPVAFTPLVAAVPADAAFPTAPTGTDPSVTVHLVDVAAELAGSGASGTPVEPSWPPLAPPGLEGEPGGQPAPGTPQAPVAVVAAPEPVAAQPVRRPLHAGPPIPDPSLMTGQVPVRSLADRGPSGQGATPPPGVPPVPPVGPVAVAAPLAVAVPAQPAVEAEQLVTEPVAAEPVAVAPVVAEPVVVEPVVEPVVLPAQAVVADPVAPVVPVTPAEMPSPEEVAAVVAQEVPVQDAAVQEAPIQEAPAQDTAAQEAAAPAEQVEPAPAQPVAPAAVVAEPGVDDAVAPVPPQAVVEPAVVDAVVVEAAVVEPVVEPAQDPAQPPVAEPTAEAAQVAEPAAAVEQPAVEQPAVEQPAAAPAAPPAHPRRISAFLAAPAPLGLPIVEPVPAQPVAPAVAEQRLAADQPAAPEQPSEPEAAEVPVVPAITPTADTPAAAEPALDAVPVASPAEAAAGAELAVAVAVAAAQALEAADAPDAPAPAEAAQTAAGTGVVPSVTAAPAEARPEPTATPDAPEAAAVDAPVDPQAPEAPVDAEVTAGAEPAAEVAADADADVPRPPAAPGYDEAMREAVHQVMRERRDIRNGFRPDPVPHEVLLRVLEAAHTAPSVGYSQPWDFVVIRSSETRRKMHELAARQREAFADSLPKGRAKQFKEIKIEAILDTPVNIVVTADRTRGGRHTLGRHTQPQMAPYSAALAVENLWLAARAEGLGVGWVSFFDEEEMVRELGLPEHLDVVAYLCVGYVDAFPDEPELQQQGWAKKRPLSWVVHEEQYGNRALPGEEPHSVLSETLRTIRPLDAKALGESWDRQKRMTKPAGSLGMLEIIAAQLSGLSRKCPPPIPEPACVAIFAGDHGVHAQGVTPWPQEVTAQMVANFLAGGAVVNSFAAQVGAEVCVVDVGVASELPEAIQQGRTTGLLPRKVKAGTDDMTQGPAMTREEALKALEVGIETARDLVAAGNKVLITGDMGIANTTASAALISVFAGADPAEVTGRGTGIDDETHARKVDVIRRALELHHPDPADPIGVLAAVGGLEHAAIAGFLLGAASLRTPVILDGVIAGSAALAAKAIAPEVLAACIAGHRSAEPGHQAALAKLGLRPLIDLDLRLGEGTGALLALPLVQSAARAMHDVATFDSAGVTEKA